MIESADYYSMVKSSNQTIIDKQKGVHAKEVKLAIQHLLNKVKKLNLVPSTGPSGLSRPSLSGRTSAPRQFKNNKFLLPYGTRYINNELPMGVELDQYMFILEPEPGIFYLNSQNHMCFNALMTFLLLPLNICFIFSWKD